MKKLEQLLLFLTIFFLPTQLGKHFWPSFSFIYSLPIDYLSPVIYFWDLLAVVLFVTFLINKGQINKLALNLGFFFLLTQSVSLLSSTNPAAGLVRLEQYLVVIFLGIYLASIKLKVFKKIIMWGLILGILIEGVLAGIQFITGSTVGLWILGERSFTISTPGIAKFDFYNFHFLRPYGTFPHPNVLAGFMIIAILIIVILRRLAEGSLTNVSYFATVLLAGLTLLLTVSRVAIVAGVGSALVTLNKKGRMFLLLLLLLLLPVLYTRFASVFNFDVISLIRREQQIGIAFTLWTKHPIFGVGLNNFIISASDQLLAGPSRFLQPVHNIFLLELAETGVIGFIGFIVLIGYPFLKNFKFQISNFKLLWFVILFLGMFDHYFLTLPQGYRMLFLVWGISISSLKVEGKS